jgi:hypothetical protein
MTKTREELAVVGREVRAYFAPVDRATGTPTVFDPAQQGAFALDTPPAPWVSLGVISGFKRTSATKNSAAAGGKKGACAAQFRKQLDARIEFDFREWGKLQMALACGAQHMNVLAEAAGASALGSGGAAAAAVAVQSGSDDTRIIVGASAISQFGAGDIVAVDVDYINQVGYVGSGIVGAYVKAAADVGASADYMRRATLNVGRIVSTDATSFYLDQPLLGGAPLSGAKVQKVIAFVDREGGSFFHEWSALFIVPESSGGRVCFYYPRLQAAAPASEATEMIAKPLEQTCLHGSFIALPVTDPNDSEQVVCYRSYFPAAGASLY